MVREIVKFGSKVLRRTCDPIDPVNRDDPEVRGLLEDLFDTLEEADGVGLAAPQIGVGRRALIVDISSQDPSVPAIGLINPRITRSSGMAIGEEGCLSIPELYGDVGGFAEIEVETIDVEGETYRFEAEGFYARVLQHEIDHLDGKLFIDYISPLKRQLMRGALKRLQKEGEMWDSENLPA